MKSHNTQNGFAIGTILMVIILLGAVVGAMALSARSTSTDLSPEKAKAAASAIIKMATDTRFAMDLIEARGYSDKRYIVQTEDGLLNPGVGLYNPTYSTALKYTISNEWTSGLGSGLGLMNTIKLNGVGTQSGEDMLLALPWTSENICKAINKILYGDEAIPTTAYNLNAGGGWLSGSPVDETSNANFAGWTDGCIKTADNHHIYFKTMDEY